MPNISGVPIWRYGAINGASGRAKAPTLYIGAEKTEGVIIEENNGLELSISALLFNTLPLIERTAM